MIRTVCLISSLLLFSAGSFAKDGPCMADRQKFCSQCEKGQRECVKKCMKEHQSELSAECKAKIEERKKSKSGKSKETK